MTTESFKVRVGDQWEDDYKNRYIITRFSTSIECYFFLISKGTGRIAGRLDACKYRSLYGAQEGQNPPEPIYNEKAREALNITEDMVFISRPDCLEAMGQTDEKEPFTESRGKTHKISNERRITVCGLYITYPGGLVEPATDDHRKVTCRDCLEEMGEANSEQQSANTYTGLAIQPWYFIEANQLSFLEGSVIKRVCRHRRKDGAKDIDKAIDELQKLKKHEYGESHKQNQGKSE